MIILIVGLLSTSAKFHKIPQQYQNPAEKGTCRGSARNSVTRGKLLALVTINSLCCNFAN